MNDQLLHRVCDHETYRRTGGQVKTSPAMDQVTDKNVDAVLAREAYASADAMIAERNK